jgi:hypothetical protein
MKIQIIECSAVGGIFANLTPGSIHEVVTPPKAPKEARIPANYENNDDGVWVQGVGEPVRVLRREYMVIG